MNAGQLEDRLAIRELIETFAVGAMRIDADIWGSTWAEEGSWKLPSMAEPTMGKRNVVAAFKEKMGYVRIMSMISFPTDLVIDGDRARGKAYCQELIFPKAGGQRFTVGCFDDEYVKRDGRWYFVSRVYEVLGADPPPAA
jgi:SnoaL-like domain